MENFVRKNWLGMFLIFLILSMLILGIVAININNGLENFLIKPQGDDKRMDVIGSILGTSVAIASALVAIFLSRIALQFAENENKRGFKEIIEKRILEIREINTEIMFAAKELKFISIDSLSKITDLSKSDELEEEKTNLMKNEVSRNKESLQKFSEAIKKLETNSIVKQHYINGFNQNEEFYNKQYNEMKDYNVNSTINPKKVSEIAIQMENKYIEELPLDHILLHFTRLINDGLLENYDERKRDWILFSFIFGYGIGFYIYNKNPKLLGAISALDILINLPSTKDFIEFSKKYDKDIDEETAKNMIMTITGAIEEDGKIKDLDDEIKDTLKNVRKILIDNFEDILYYNHFNSGLDAIFNIAKGLAIHQESEFVELDHVFYALSVVDLSEHAEKLFVNIINKFYCKEFTERRIFNLQVTPIELINKVNNNFNTDFNEKSNNFIEKFKEDLEKLKEKEAPAQNICYVR